MNILIQKLDEKAFVPFKKEGQEDDFCYDCVATSCEEVSPGVFKYGLGIAVQPEGTFDGTTIRGITLRPRSSIYKTGMILSNSIGTIDENYTGQMYVVFYHVMKDLPRYQVGDKVCQLVLDKTETLTFKVVDKLRKTVRAAGGLGSTGLKPKEA